MVRIEPQVDTAKIHLNAVRLLESHFSTSTKFQQNEILPMNTNIQIGQESRVNIDTNYYGVRMDIILTALDDKENEIGLNARYIIQFGFTVDNLKDLVNIVGSDVNINHLLAVNIIGIAYSTARGIILERTQGSFFNGAILPIINPASILIETPTEAPSSSDSPDVK